MRSRSNAFAAVLALLAVASLAAEDLPPAPEGFTWKKVAALKAAFLLPRGWHYKEEGNGDGHGIFISKEDIDAQGEFQTGLSVNVVRLKKEKAQERARVHIAQLSQMDGNDVQHLWETENNGVLKGYGARIRRTEKDYPPHVMHVLAIGNSRTNALYILMFESPKAGWDSAWSQGEQMLKLFFLDDEY